jgi:transposase
LCSINLSSRFFASVFGLALLVPFFSGFRDVGFSSIPFMTKALNLSSNAVIIQDNYKVHTSNETQKYLETVPEKFKFVFTPKHASWLNIIESFFSKMVRSVLRGIRVDSTDELRERIGQYINQINEKPVLFTWRYKMEERDVMPGGITI